jgi:hypothetical protein
MNFTELPRAILVTFTAVCLVAALSLVMFAPQSVWAGHPVSVDPSTLNPPPPPAFNPVCEKSGFGTLCTVNFSDPPFAGDSGLACGSGANTFEVFQFSTRSVQGRRYYDQNGNLLKRHFREYLAGTLSNPLNHKAVSFSGSVTHVHDLAIPGDNTSGTERLSGGTRYYLQNGGIVLIDAGRATVTEDGTILSEAGQHPFDEYFVFGDTTALQSLCDALAN